MRALFIVIVFVAGCASHTVRCERRLSPVNGPVAGAVALPRSAP